MKYSDKINNKLQLIESQIVELYNDIIFATREMKKSDSFNPEYFALLTNLKEHIDKFNKEKK